MLELNKIYNMDCIEWMKLIPDWSIDCIITDPPYWQTACKRDTVIPFEPMREQLKRIIKPNWAIVLFGSEPFSSALRMSNIKMYKYDWIWETHKWKNPMLAKIQPMKKHETISIFWEWKVNYYPQMEEWKPYKQRWQHNKMKEHNIYASWKSVWYAKDFDSSKRYPTSVLKFANHNQKINSFHPTQKPVALIEYLIKTYSNEWEKVLDFTMWSWTTAVACQNTNRNFIWFELDKWYREIANNRILQNNEKNVIKMT